MNAIANQRACTPTRRRQSPSGPPGARALIAVGGSPPLLTRCQLAIVLQIAPRTLDRRRAAGEVLDPLPGPGRPRWLAAEVTAWLEAGRPCASVWRQLRSRRRGS